MENKTRLNWIDWAKSIGICIVVLCHVPQYPTFEHGFFCSFQMPLFFIISGFLHKNSDNFVHALKKYWITLIIPYFLFQFIFYPYWYIAQRYDGNDISTIYTALIEPFLKCLIGIPINGVTWFLVALLIIKLYANYILSKPCRIRLTIISCTIVIVARYFMYMNNDDIKISFAIDSMLMFFPFFFIGYFMKKYAVLDHISKNKRNLSILLPISFVALVILLISNSPSYSCLLFFFYLKGLSGSLFILGICIILNNIRSSIIYTISNGTILIFGLHWMFIGSFNFFLKQILGIDGDIKYSFPIAILITLGIVFINYFIILLCKKHFPVILGYRK